MHVGIDARMYGVTNRGIGRYLERLLDHLAGLNDSNRYTVFVGREIVQALRLPSGKFKITVADIPWYGAHEQIIMPRFIRRAQVDLMHFPHWNVPYFCPAPYVVTIHDLLLLHFPDERATTLPKWKYRLKLKAARALLRRAASKAERIITISQFTKRDIMRHLGARSEKITVTYLGADKMVLGAERLPNLSPFDDYLSGCFGITKPYLLYVGSAYPHKNLENLCRALALLREQYNRNWQLVLAGRRDYFYERLQTWAHNDEAVKSVARDIIFTDEVSDKDLDGLYRAARLFVLPSLYEGFGLPPLEAMSRGLPVVAAKASSVPEILADAACYFAPEDAADMARACDLVGGSRKIAEELIHKGFARAKHFSWEEAAQETVAVYNSFMV